MCASVIWPTQGIFWVSMVEDEWLTSVEVVHMRRGKRGLGKWSVADRGDGAWRNRTCRTQRTCWRGGCWERGEPLDDLDGAGGGNRAMKEGATGSFVIVER